MLFQFAAAIGFLGVGNLETLTGSPNDGPITVDMVRNPAADGPLRFRPCLLDGMRAMMERLVT